MAHLILSDMSASVSELKKHPIRTVAVGGGLPVAILSQNKPAFYCVPAQHYEQLLSYMEDLEDEKLVRERENGVFIEVNIDDL